jgi:hypothetical protein
VGGSGSSTSCGTEDINTDALRDRLRRDLQRQELIAISTESVSMCYN